jgi:glycosyltransferase involved in cell wall biosynthesis
LISVIIPAYNASKSLPACLAALHRQSLLPDEIILVDDGSTDTTSSVAQENGARVIQQPHQGPAAARNLGVREACGDMVVFTDADCVPSPSWLAEMVRPFSDPRVTGVKGSYSTSQTQVVARLVQCEFEERYDRQKRFPYVDFIDSYSAAFRTSILRDLGGFDPAFPQANNEDVELSYRLHKSGCLLVFNRQAVVSHTHPSTWGAYFRVKLKRGYWRMLVYRLYPGKALRDSYTPQLLKLQVLLALLVGLFAACIPLIPSLGWASLASLLALWFSAVPFFRRAGRKNPALVIPAIAFITLRALAFALGIIGGLASMFFFHPAGSEVRKNAVRQHA